MSLIVKIDVLYVCSYFHNEDQVSKANIKKTDHFTCQDGYAKNTTTRAGAHTEKLAASWTAGENVKWYSCFEKVWQFLKMLNRN